MEYAGDWGALPAVTFMGAVCTAQRYHSKSLVRSVISHWVYNIWLTLPVFLLTRFLDARRLEARRFADPSPGPDAH